MRLTAPTWRNRMRPEPFIKALAWAPWGDGDRAWLLRRDDLATEWLRAQAQDHGSDVIIQAAAGAAHYRREEGAIGDLAREGKVATYLSRVGNGATLAPGADIRLLATAMLAADGHSIATTELPGMALLGLAMATRALNLATGEVTEDQRTPEQKWLLEAFVPQLYNGWSHKQVGRVATIHYLPLMVDAGMSYMVFVGSLLAICPQYLDSNSDIDAMKRALPPTWQAEASAARWSWLDT
jgi:hypothetical protein